MDERIMKKPFFIRKYNRRTYCSICGRLIPGDYYNAKQHLMRHNIENPEVIFVEENQSFAYGFKTDVSKRKINLYIFEPVLILRPGFSELFSEAVWKQVYTCTFKVGSKEILEKGKHDLEYYSNKLEDMICLNAEGCLKDAIENVFRTWIKDYDTFFRILRTRGFHYTEKMEPESAERHLKEELQRGTKRFPIYHLGTFAKITTVVENKDMYLKVQVFDNEEKVLSFLAGDDYFYMGERKDDVKDILKRIRFCLYDQNELDVFSTRYPEYKISEFMKGGGQNLLIPLLSERYDYCLELLIKAGCMTMADHLYLHEKHIKSNRTDFVEIFRVPAKIIRKLSVDSSQCKGALTVLEKTRKLAPDFLQQMDVINESLIVFLKNNLLVSGGRRRTTEISGFDELNNKQKLRMARYVNTLSLAEYNELYVDYLNMCVSIRESFQIEPKGDTLRDLHDRVLRRYLDKMDKQKEMMFENQINSAEYKELEIKKEKEDFFVIAPKNIDDVYREGRDMSNCVATYVPRILDGSTQILFLRQSSEPKDSFGTIEVRGNKLYQAKAKYNQRLPKEAQAYVRKWCKEKGLSINTRDISVSG